MQRTKKFPLVQNACSSSEILQRFVTNNENLEIILKSLDMYLNNKRMGFPRFYFLSNDELLELLSQIKTPPQMQPFLRKCFDNIASLEYEEVGDTVQLNKIISMEPETMPESFDFIEKVQLGPTEKLEQWLNKIQDGMIKTLRELTHKALVGEMDFREWALQDLPSQALVTVSYIHWQCKISSILEKGVTTDDLQHELDRQQEMIQTLITIVKEDLSICVRQLICTLLLVRVQLRNIIENFISQRLSGPDDFLWNMQLRFYLDMETKNAYIRQVHAKLFLSYEYLGNTTRLVVTPLQERCFLTMTNALQICLGGSPAGPAGTGKTESVKDLSKALQIKCVVFNC